VHSKRFKALFSGEMQRHKPESERSSAVLLLELVGINTFRISPTLQGKY